jgi:hypothetical protein
LCACAPKTVRVCAVGAQAHGDIDAPKCACAPKPMRVCVNSADAHRDLSAPKCACAPNSVRVCAKTGARVRHGGECAAKSGGRGEKLGKDG